MPKLSNGAYILKHIELSVTVWCELYLLRKPVCGREIPVAFDKYTTDDKHRTVWRSNLCREAICVIPGDTLPFQLGPLMTYSPALVPVVRVPT
jgi:hypothetical protein